MIRVEVTPAWGGTDASVGMWLGPRKGFLTHSQNGQVAVVTGGQWQGFPSLPSLRADFPASGARSTFCFHTIIRKVGSGSYSHHGASEMKGILPKSSTW